MRSTFVLVFLAAVGCDSGGSNNNKHDMSMMLLHDLSMTNPGCDVAAQDCGGSGMKCVTSFDANGNIGGTCVADGTLTEAQPCTPAPDGSDTLTEDCKKGLVCDLFFYSATPVCRTICTDDSMCPSSQRCISALNGADFGWCEPTCTPFSTTAGNCPANSDCGDNNTDFADGADGSNKGFFICKPTGTGALFESCSTDGDCGTGLWCDASNGFCTGNCKTDNDCPVPGADGGAAGLMGFCFNYDDTPNMAGACFYQ